LYGEVFHVFELEVDRLSESKDILCVTISERLLTDITLSEGDFIRVNGQLRSYNKVVENRNKLVLTVFARSIEVPEERAKDPNEILLDGFICKAPVYRKTPFGREITDILVAVNRAYNKSDYIPIIAWGRNARYSKNLEIGERIKVCGRLQSREYVKNVSETEKVTRVAYEVSVSRLELVKQDEARNEDEESSLA
jgi:single-stranded DNA-binding protein